MIFCKDNEHEFKVVQLWIAEKVKVLAETKEPESNHLSCRKTDVCIKCGVPREIFENKGAYMDWKAGKEANERMKKFMEKYGHLFVEEWGII